MKTLIGFLVLLTIIDLVLASLFLGGPEYEVNLIAKYIWTNYGLIGLSLFKLGGVSLAISLLQILRSKNLQKGLLLYGIVITGLACLTYIPYIYTA